MFQILEYGAKPLWIKGMAQPRRWRPSHSRHSFCFRRQANRQDQGAVVTDSGKEATCSIHRHRWTPMQTINRGLLFLVCCLATALCRRHLLTRLAAKTVRPMAGLSQRSAGRARG